LLASAPGARFKDLKNLEIPGVISCLLAIPQTCLAPSRRAEKAHQSVEWNKGKANRKPIEAWK